MLRIVASVIGGYLIIVLVVFTLFSGAYLLLGADRAFEPGSYQVTGLWIAASVVLGLIAALVGGLASRAIARTQTGPRILAGVVLALGIVVALTVALSPAKETAARPASVPNLEAMHNAQQPLWVAILNPLLGAAGVLLGARLKK